MNPSLYKFRQQSQRYRHQKRTSPEVEAANIQETSILTESLLSEADIPEPPQDGIHIYTGSFTSNKARRTLSQGPVTKKEAGEIVRSAYDRGETAYIWYPGLDDWVEWSGNMAIKVKSLRKSKEPEPEEDQEVTRLSDDEIASLEIWIDRNGERFGPMGLEKLRSTIEDGNLTDEDLLWFEELGDEWLPSHYAINKLNSLIGEEEERKGGEEEKEQEEQEEEPDIEADDADIIGFWMIPYGESFLKLKILQKYSSSIPRMIDPIGIKAFNRKEPVYNNLSGRWYPVWAVLTHLDALTPHFRWLEPSPSNDALYDPEDDHHEDAVEVYQRKLMSHDWEFFIVDGSNAYVGSQDVSRGREQPQFIEPLIKEIYGVQVQSPRNVRVDISEVEHVHFMSPGGHKISTSTLEELKDQFARDRGEEENRGEGKEQSVREADMERKELFIDILKRDVKMEDVDHAKLRDLFSPEVYARMYKTLSQGSKDRARTILREYLIYAKAQDWPADIESYMDESYEDGDGREQLDEVSYRKLYRLTGNNGVYAVGGLRRVNGVWIVDPAVPGRMDNARFVITRAPRIYLGEDGFFQIRYNFRSRNDRCTTGVSQVGYVKFLPPDKGLLKNILRWAKRLFVAETAWDSDVHTWCSCPDFKYRWHWVLADAGASHVPTGAGGEASNVPPNRTNPTKKMSLCKHLVAVGPFIQNTPREFKDRVNQMVQNQVKEPPIHPVAPEEEPEIGVNAELEEE